ncbi:hypothetical protein E2K80_09600 [Rhodophyticola sp. CCM32]|uniref:hypothetical protein n=1 Tax=Rhodophyticola sp. CCM32 TaxID=2916397 RepID=UPI00107F99C1|nr:hypothetical protein [Rhodophyticola sp. CCM32]QBY00950.1 hypothetical protein E2K80_09600 [Rhodophyticola sp. CCM32]
MDPGIILVIAGTGSVSAWLAFVLGRYLSPLTVYLFWAALLILSLWMLINMNRQTGWDAIGSAVLLFFVALPAAVGALIGGVAGISIRRKRHMPDGDQT